MSVWLLAFQRDEKIPFFHCRGARLVYHDFFWNESLGWFMWESRPERTGDAVYIWSELKGVIVVR